MVFSSPEFLLLYFPVVLMLYYAVPEKYRKWRNIVLFAVSLVFYGWGAPKHVFLMLFTITVDYIFGLLIEKHRDQPKRAKTELILAVICNLAILAFFKYANFIVANLSLIPGLENLPSPKVTLPLGISFYTFQALSYVIDVYRRDAEAQHSYVAFGTYVTIFPQLVAGPIVKYRDVDEQLTNRHESVALFASGVRTLTAGLGKKLILGNIASSMWESLSAVPADEKTVLGAWLGILFYTFHIYFDFSGYSDMAIGLGKMLGFRFLENFNYPYIAKSITDFWRRWHISLSTWFREYVYIPLGGNRCAQWKVYRNLLVVWLLTGVWHGANWNYILWGLYYFVLLVIEKAFFGKVLEKLPAILRHLYAVFLIMIGWLLFVSTDLSAGFSYLGNLFGVGVSGFTSAAATYDLVRNLGFLVIMAVAATPYPKRLFYKLYEKSKSGRVLAVAGCAAVLVLSVVYLISSSYNPFIYYIF